MNKAYFPNNGKVEGVMDWESDLMGSVPVQALAVCKPVSLSLFFTCRTRENGQDNI